MNRFPVLLILFKHFNFFPIKITIKKISPKIHNGQTITKNEIRQWTMRQKYEASKSHQNNTSAQIHRLHTIVKINLRNPDIPTKRPSSWSQNTRTERGRGKTRIFILWRSLLVRFFWFFIFSIHFFLTGIDKWLRYVYVRA